MSWNTKIKNENDLHGDLKTAEIMRLRRQCEKMYDALRLVYRGILDTYETPEKELKDRVERLYQNGKSAGIILNHIDNETKF